MRFTHHDAKLGRVALDMHQCGDHDFDNIVDYLRGYMDRPEHALELFESMRYGEFIEIGDEPPEEDTQ